MSNHCFEVICLSCGRQWCERGCSYQSEGPSESAIESWVARMKDIQVRNNKPFNISKLKERYNVNVTCACGAKEVVAD